MKCDCETKKETFEHVKIRSN